MLQKKMRQKVPARSNERKKYFPGKINAVVSTETDKLPENTEEGQYQEFGDGCT